MLKNFLKIKMSRDRLEAFHKQCGKAMEAYEPDNDHDKLLREFLVDMYLTLDSMLHKTQEKFTLKLSNAEALAFYQVWQQVPLDHCPYSKVLVDEALLQIDQFHKSPQNKYRYAIT